jgi:hypothetical protein
MNGVFASRRCRSGRWYVASLAGIASRSVFAYELREEGLVDFDDSDAPNDVNMIRDVLVTAAGRALLER